MAAAASRIVHYSEQTWNESDHPRDERGRFAFTSNHRSKWTSKGDVPRKPTAFRGPVDSPTSFFYDMEGKEHYYQSGGAYTHAVTSALIDNVDKEFDDLDNLLGSREGDEDDFFEGVESEIESVGEGLSRSVRLMGHAISRAVKEWSGITTKETQAVRDSLDAVHAAIDEGFGELLVAVEEASDSDDEDVINDQLESVKNRVQESIQSLSDLLNDTESAIDDRDSQAWEQEVEFVSEGVEELNEMVENGDPQKEIEDHAKWWNNYLKENDNRHRIALADDDTWWYWEMDDLDNWPGKDD